MLIGEKFGRLTLLERVVVGERKKTHYLCQCSCGNKKLIRSDAIQSGVTTSCGCYHKERIVTHGLSKTRLFKAWDSMKQRCYNTKCESYVDYGGRGISICDEWRYDFKAFYEWAMSNGYESHLTIDRYPDNDSNYEPGNCRWVTMVEQNRNRRNTFSYSQIADIRQDPRTHQAIAEDYGVNQSTITRIKNGLRWKDTDEGTSNVTSSNINSCPTLGVNVLIKDTANMARIHDTIAIESVGQYPSLGVLIGSRGSHDVFDAINANGHASFFGSDFENVSKEFFNRYVRPMDQINLEISRTINAVMNPDQFRILDTIEDFRSIPSCMEMSIVLFAPVRQGILEGRMEGFGWDPTSLPSEDVYGRILSNFNCEDIAAVANENGFFDLEAQTYSDDPELDDDQLYAIRKTRNRIMQLLEETDRDPTAIDLPRG